MMLLFKKLKYDTEICKQSLHEIKSVSHKTGQCSGKSVSYKTENVGHIRQGPAITTCEIMDKLLTLKQINGCD